MRRASDLTLYATIVPEPPESSLVRNHQSPSIHIEMVFGQSLMRVNIA